MIILDNEHRFKEDPEYGHMLKRMWSGNLTKEDCKRINTRVLGTNGLELPPELEGKQINKIFQIGINWFSLIPHDVNTSLYFSRRRMLRMSNKQGTKFYPSSIFQEHIQATHPNVTCNEMPLEHTLI